MRFGHGGGLHPTATSATNRVLAVPRIPHHQVPAGHRPEQGGQLILTADKAHRARHPPSPPGRTRLLNPGFIADVPTVKPAGTTFSPLMAWLSSAVCSWNRMIREHRSNGPVQGESLLGRLAG